MRREIDVTFRGLTSTVVATLRNTGGDTVDVEWRFDGLTIEEHNDLCITPDEEDAITAALLDGYVPGEDALGDEVT